MMIRSQLNLLGTSELDDRSPGPLQIYRILVQHPEAHWLLAGHCGGPTVFTVGTPPFPDGPPERANALLQRVATYCQETRCQLKLGDVLPGENLGKPSDFPDMPEELHLTGFIVVPDPILPEVDGPAGPVPVRRLLGVTQDEIDLIESWNALSFAEELAHLHPSLLTRVDRRSMLTGTFLQRCIQRAGREGSSLGQLHFSGGWSIDEHDSLHLHIPGGEEASRILNVLRGRLPFDRPLFLVGPEGAGTIAFVPRDGFRAILQDDDTLVFFGRIHTPEIQQILSFFDPDGPGVIAQLD